MWTSISGSQPVRSRACSVLRCPPHPFQVVRCSSRGHERTFQDYEERQGGVKQSSLSLRHHSINQCSLQLAIPRLSCLVWCRMTQCIPSTPTVGHHTRLPTTSGLVWVPTVTSPMTGCPLHAYVLLCLLIMCLYGCDDASVNTLPFAIEFLKMKENVITDNLSSLKDNTRLHLLGSCGDNTFTFT